VASYKSDQPDPRIPLCPLLPFGGRLDYWEQFMLGSRNHSQRSRFLLLASATSVALAIFLISVGLPSACALPTSPAHKMSFDGLARQYNRARAKLYQVPSAIECKMRKLEGALLSLRGGSSERTSAEKEKEAEKNAAATTPASPRKWEPSAAAEFHDHLRSHPLTHPSFSSLAFNHAHKLTFARICWEDLVMGPSRWHALPQ
jgi:hypothetical protein